jgi:hypothetical protein
MITAYTYHEICPEMLKLRNMLDKMNIDWEDDSDHLTPNTIECRVYRTKFYINSDTYSVIYGYGTYGGWNRFLEKGDPKLLELMINDEEPTGWHTAENIINIMKERENAM